MTDYLVLGVVAILVGAVCLTLGYAVGQGLCRRAVRAQLWTLFSALDQDPQFGALRWDILNLIKRLEL